MGAAEDAEAKAKADAEAADAAAKAADEAKAKADADAADAAVPLEGDVTVIVQTYISGSRDGQPWPAVGDELVLPADEAEQYLKFGYVRLPE